MFTPPESFNLADHILDARLREGRGARIAVRTATGSLTFAEITAQGARFGNLLTSAGILPEQRVMIALPDGPDYVAALFGILKMGAVVVMVNPDLKPDAIAQLFAYTRASAVWTDPDHADVFTAASQSSARCRAVFVTGTPAFDTLLASAADALATFPTHRDDPAIWLFSGGTTGRPKAVVQTHRAFAYTTACYGHGVLDYRENDITMSVPKLFFGYATGSNLLFPFSVGASCVLFPERCTAEELFSQLERHRPTILVNVPSMVNQMVNHRTAAARDLRHLRLATSAGEALPIELDRRWRDTFGVDLLDGLGTAEQWHIFISNRPGAARPGTIGQVVPGFTVKVCGEDGAELPDGETGWLWVTGGARAIGYWQLQEQTERAFRGEWYVSGDLVSRDPDGFFTYQGRADDLLKVRGKWLSPQEVESCLLEHPHVREVAVIGAADDAGLIAPVAFVVLVEPGLSGARQRALTEELKTFARERLDAYKHPREIVFLDTLPRTHLGKVDRGALKRR